MLRSIGYFSATLVLFVLGDATRTTFFTVAAGAFLLAGIADLLLTQYAKAIKRSENV